MNDISTNKLNLAQLENKVNNYDSGWSKFFDVLKNYRENIIYTQTFEVLDAL